MAELRAQLSRGRRVFEGEAGRLLRGQEMSTWTAHVELKACHDVTVTTKETTRHAQNRGLDFSEHPGVGCGFGTGLPGFLEDQSLMHGYT
eukprot:m.28236 g.28236  ORF g.28236 m.28236 type:complete len:90 (+) comp30628_c0_seq2:1230-1499(+)